MRAVQLVWWAVRMVGWAVRQTGQHFERTRSGGELSGELAAGGFWGAAETKSAAGSGATPGAGVGTNFGLGSRGLRLSGEVDGVDLAPVGLAMNLPGLGSRAAPTSLVLWHMAPGCCAAEIAAIFLASASLLASSAARISEPSLAALATWRGLRRGSLDCTASTT